MSAHRRGIEDATFSWLGSPGATVCVAIMKIVWCRAFELSPVRCHDLPGASALGAAQLCDNTLLTSEQMQSSSSERSRSAMADEGEGNLAEERNQIKQLQSDIARKREQLERLKQRKIAFDEELKQRNTELSFIKEEHKSTQKKAQKTSQYGDAQKKAEAESHFMSEQVHSFLQDRIPAMAPSQEEPDGVDQGAADFKENVGEDPNKQNLHDTVLVSYVNLSGDKKDDDYKVTYRIDGSITVADLLKVVIGLEGLRLICLDNERMQAYSANRIVLGKKIGSPRIVLAMVCSGPFWVPHVPCWHKCLAKSVKNSAVGKLIQHGILQMLQLFLDPAFQDLQEAVEAALGEEAMAKVLLTRNVTLPPPRAAQFLWATWAQIPAGRKLVLESQGECRRLRVFVHGLSSAGAIFKIGRGAKLEIRNMEIDSINPCRNSRKCCIYFAISEPPHPLTSVGLQLSKVKLATHLQHKMLTTKSVRDAFAVREGLPVSSRPPEDFAHLQMVRQNAVFQKTKSRTHIRMFHNSSTCGQARRPAVQEDLAEEGKKLMTLKLGLGNVAAEHVTEPFVEALKTWPGVYKLLKKRNRKHDMQKWLRTRLADFLVFGVLIIFSIACFFLRSEIENYLLRFGVENALVVGIPNETSTGIFLEMEDVSTVGAAEQYLRGCFDYQLFNPQSTLRKFYTPVGDIRFRVQKAALKTCTRPEIPATFARSCRYVEVSSSMQDEKDLLFDDDALPELANLLMNVSGNPTMFSKSTVATDEIWGKNGALYSGSGYSFWFPINPSNLANVTTKMGELDWLWPQWLTGDTRMLAVEFTLANYHAGGYVSTVLLLEIFPSGASRFTAVLLPFHLAKTSGDITADVLDIFRWIIIIGYLCLYKVWRTCEDYVRDGFSGLRYVLSPAGLLDAASIGLFIALQYWRSSKVKPVEPMSSSNSQHFVSYSRWASWEEMAAIGEAVLVFLLIVRYTTLLRFYPPVYRFFVLFSKSFRVGLYYLAIFVPVAASTIFFANCLYGPP
ncbi:unnamed protein product, partial [Symbiodinium microadriaticum]